MVVKMNPLAVTRELARSSRRPRRVTARPRKPPSDRAHDHPAQHGQSDKQAVTEVAQSVARQVSHGQLVADHPSHEGHQQPEGEGHGLLLLAGLSAHLGQHAVQQFQSLFLVQSLGVHQL